MAPARGKPATGRLGSESATTPLHRVNPRIVLLHSPPHAYYIVRLQFGMDQLPLNIGHSAMDDPPTENRMMRFFSSNPVIGMIGAAASVISIPLALFFFISEQKTRDLTAFVHPVRTSVVRMGQASKLSVKFEDRPIDSDVTAVQIAIWNRGGLSIRAANLLKPIAIVMPGRQILEATIKKQTRDVVNFRLDSAKLTEGRVPLNWDILEQGDGAVIQLLYPGDDTADIDFEGVLEGQPSVTQLHYSLKVERPEDQYPPGRWHPLILGIGLVSVPLSCIALYSMLSSMPLKRNRRFAKILVGAGCLCICAFTLFVLYQSSRQCLGPPFGF